jgi:outer membrane protein insertion porin family
MKWIERAIRPAPGMAPRGQVTKTATEPAAAVQGAAAPTASWLESAVSPDPRARVGSPSGSRLHRAGLGSRLGAIVLVCASAMFGLAIDPTSAWAQGDRFPEGTITKIEFEGNATITPDKIKPKLLSKVGQPLDQEKVEADLKSLLGTKWFSDVRPFYDETPPKSGKYTLTFRVREMPLLTRVEFKGRTAIRQKELEDTTGLKVGNRADPTRTRLAIQQIQRLYSEKGYDMASVTLLEGGNTGDTKVVIEIFEGPKVQIGSIGFVGNEFATDARLKTMIGTRKPILGLFGKYHRDMLDEDKQKLIEYYQKQGFFEVKVAPVTRPNNEGKVELTFVISEGTRYQVRNEIIEGNTKIKTEVLREGLELHSGKPFLDSVRDADKRRLLAKYYEIGCIEADIVIEPKFTEQHGVVDLLFKIEEKEPYLLGELEIVGNARTKDKVVRREAVQAGLLPGEVLDKNRIDMYKRRLGSLGYFGNDPNQGKQIKVEIVRKRPKDKPYGDLMMPLLGEVQQARMQDPGPGLDLTPAPAQPAPAPGTTVEPNPFGPNNAFSPPPNTLPPVEVPPAGPSPFLPPGVPGRGPAVGNAPAAPVGAGEPPASFPSMPGMNMTDVSPDRNDPFPNRAFADIVTSVEEAPTGRFMIGVGANSFQGLMGTISIFEKNFDIFNIPRSFSDITNGQAFRGGGQEFRINLQAGNLINMIQVSLREPYLFDLPIGAGATGYLSSRIYPNWDERRGGGRFSLGRQIGTSMYADVAVRAEEVDFFGYRSPAPANYLAASGFTSLFSIRPSLRWDNRNNPMMATKGQYVEISAEQGWGSFTWSKFDAEGRMYIPTISRPDGSGKQFFTLRGKFGVATESTPVYERYFAGNFGSLRGFQYRTVSPHAFDVPTGGVMMAVGSVEYQFPWNARDTFNQIFFTDFGTVTGNYELNAPRVSVGTGLKVMIPAFGPIPFEFDLAFPVLKQTGDRVQFFNFTVGGFY